MAQRHGNAKVDVAMVSLLPQLVPSITKLLHLPDRIRDMSSARLLLGIRYCVEEKKRFFGKSSDKLSANHSSAGGRSSSLVATSESTTQTTLGS